MTGEPTVGGRPRGLAPAPLPPPPGADEPVRAMVVCCPDWPVVAAGGAPDAPMAVVHANRVRAATPAARAEGVVPGQRRREAQGRCPSVVVVEHDEGRDARAFEDVARAVEAFAPRLELSVPGRATVPTRGPSRYFGGDDALADRVVAAVDAVLAPRGWAGHVRVGVADGAFAAGLAADGAPGPALVLPPGASPRFLAPHPVAVLGRPELADLLVRLGLGTLGALAALDPADVLARFGDDGWVAHRLARGLDERPPAVSDPPAELVVSAALDPPAERIDAAAFVAKALADALHERLVAAGLACTRLVVTAESEHGEVHERAWRHEGALSAGAVADRVRWQLDGWLHGSAAHRPTGGIAHLRLTPDEVGGATGRQLGFWGGEAAVDDRVVRAVARVQGLLGPQAVAVPEWRGGRGPGERVARVPAGAVDLTAARPSARPSSVAAPWPGSVPAPAPALVHGPPRAVAVVDAGGAPVGVSGRGVLSAPPARLLPVPDAAAQHAPALPLPGPGVAVTAWAGPWLVDERWWDATARRRRARLQVTCGDGRAHLLALEGGAWAVEATYD